MLSPSMKPLVLFTALIMAAAEPVRVVSTPMVTARFDCGLKCIIRNRALI